MSELEVSGSDVAKKVNSEDSTKILSGEHFRKLLNISRSDLEKRIEMAAEVLGNGILQFRSFLFAYFLTFVNLKVINS